MLAAGAAVVVATVLAGTLAAQEPTARAYVEPPEVELGGEFTLKIVVFGVDAVEDFAFRPGLASPFARHASAGAIYFNEIPPNPTLPFTTEITPATAESPGSVTFSMPFVAVMTGFFDFAPVQVTADGLTLETEPVMLLVTPPGDTGDAAVRARFEPPEVRLMERFTLVVDAPGGDLSLDDVARPDLSYFAQWRGGGSRNSSVAFRFVAFRPGTHEIAPLSVTIGGEVHETEPLTLIVHDEHRAIEVRAAVNTQRAWVGGEFVLAVEARGVQELDEDPVLPDLSGFAELLSGGPRGWGSDGETFTARARYRFRALRSGEFEIGAVTVTAAGQTVLTEPVQLAIAEAPTDPVVPPEQLRAIVTAERRRVYLGEPVFVSYQVLARDGSPFGEWSVYEDAVFTPHDHQDFQVHDLGSQSSRWERVFVDGRSYRRQTDQLVAFVPLDTGEKTIAPGEFRVQVHTQEHLGSRLGRGDETSTARMMGEWTPMTLTTDPVSVEVVPLPTEGRPESFRGHVGRVEVASWLSRTEAEVGDTVTLRVEVSGNAYLRLMPNPDIVLPEGFEIFELEVSDEPVRPRPDRVSARTLVYRLVPTREGNYRLPAVEVSWFDPGSGEYGVSRAEPFDLAIGPAGTE